MLIFIQWTQRFDSVREKKNILKSQFSRQFRHFNYTMNEHNPMKNTLPARVLLILLSDKSSFIRINTSSGEKTINHVVTTNCLIVIWFYTIKSKPFLLKMHFINFIWHHLQLINEIKCKTQKTTAKQKRWIWSRAPNH